MLESSNVIDPAESLIAIGSISHAYWCELMHPQVLNTAQIQALTELAIDTNSRITAAIMSLNFMAVPQIQQEAVQAANTITYGQDFAKVIAKKVTDISPSLPLAA